MKMIKFILTFEEAEILNRSLTELAFKRGQQNEADSSPFLAKEDALLRSLLRRVVFAQLEAVNQGNKEDEPRTYKTKNR